MKIIFLSLLLFIDLFAYIDNDIDGVDDSIDKCLNTPFDKIVDINGCAKDQLYYGKLNFEYSYSDESTKEYKIYSNSLYLNYTYNNYIIDLLKGYYSLNGIKYISDTYSSIGYKFIKNDFIIKPYIGLNTTLNNYYTLVNMAYLQNNFIYNTTIGYNQTNELNYYNYNCSINYFYSNKQNIEIYYLNSGDKTKYIGKYQNIELVYSYNFNDDYYIQIAYNRSINSSDNKIYFNIGVNFE